MHVGALRPHRRALRRSQRQARFAPLEVQAEIAVLMDGREHALAEGTDRLETMLDNHISRFRGVAHAPARSELGRPFRRGKLGEVDAARPEVDLGKVV